MKILSFILGVGVAVSAWLYYSKKPIAPGFSWDDVFVEEVSYKFHSYATKVIGKQSLQVARLQQREVYERTSKAKAFGLFLPDVIVSAEFPVEYNFSVSLLAPWKFARNENDLVVTVPELSSQTPAINVSEIRFNVKKGSLLRNEEQAKEKLRAELHTFVVDNSIRLREQVRDQAKASIRDFLLTWLEQQRGEPFPKNIRIEFANQNAPLPLAPGLNQK